MVDSLVDLSVDSIFKNSSFIFRLALIIQSDLDKYV